MVTSPNSSSQTIPRARPGAPDWRREGLAWPHQTSSRFEGDGNIVWHVQRMGEGPVALLIHGTGAATHSWAGLMPILAESYDTIAVDLPGHGFTQMRRYRRPTLENMTEALMVLLGTLDVRPSLIIGHSAGAAIMFKLVETLGLCRCHLVSLNGALKAFPGIMQVIAPSMARMLTAGGLAANLLAHAARDRERVLHLLEQTGGAPPDSTVDAYATLLKYPAHVSGTLQMMANWDLSGMEATLRGICVPTLMLSGSLDRTVSPDEAGRFASVMPNARHLRLPQVGHLAHEQAPERVADAILSFVQTPETPPANGPAATLP